MKISLLLFCAGIQCFFSYAQPGDSVYNNWEKPGSYTKTYYVNGNASNARDDGPGTKAIPFKTINRAAQVLQAGEKVIIAEAVYRESVQPLQGGSGPDKMISYEAAEGAKVIIKGSVELKGGWKKSEGWQLPEAQPYPQVWEIPLDGALFQGYNPFGMANILQNRYWLNYREINMAPFLRRRGMIFVDGKPLEQVEQYKQLLNPEISLSAYNGERWEPLFNEFSGDAGRFWIEHNGMIIHIRLKNDDAPQNHKIEITVKEQVFAPGRHGLGYIRVKSIHFEQAGNGFPVPQRGMVSTGRGHHWIIEGNTFEWANAVALDIGKEDWDAIEPEIPGCHIIRNNSIRYAGICGIAGPSVHNSLIEKNLIEWIGWQDAQRMAESAAVKFHFAKNVLFTGNVIRHIRSAAGIWLDVSNRNCRIKGNLFTDITTISAAIEIEATHDANQVDNNIIWNVRQAHPGEKEFNNSGSGIILLGTDKIGINNNLIANCSGSGVYTVAVEERLIEGRGGTARQNRVMGNIFFNCQRAAIEFSNAYNEADGNYYAAMPAGYLRVNNPLYELLDLNAWREFHGWDEHGAVVAIDGSLDPDALTWSFFVKPDSKPLRKTGSFKNTLKGYSTESIDPRIVNYGEQ